MSTETTSQTIDTAIEGTIGTRLLRLLALGCVLVLTAAYVSVLREVTLVVGGTQTLLLIVGAMLVAATVLARMIRPRTATAGAIAVAVAGFAYYVSAAGIPIGVVVSLGDELLGDALRLATGLPLLRMVAADIWVLGFVPAPVFLSWYLAVRGRYDLSVVPGGLALLFVVLTGDAGTTTTLVGTLAAMGAVGLGELERRGGSIAQADLFAVLLAVILVLSLSVTFVPDGTTDAGVGTQSGTDTLEGTIDYAGDRSGIGGSVDLSPEVRFTVESEQPSYWRTGVYDRFTGDEWVRTGEMGAYEGQLAPPPGEYDTVTHRVTPETRLGVMPTAPQPLAVEGGHSRTTELSAHGQFHPDAPLADGDSYIVESAVIDPDSDELEAAGTDYPDAIADTYLQTPEGTSNAFEERTAEITADADTPYETATAIETYLRSSKEYSLDVDRPDGNVAEEFLLEMDEGYCVYYATAMVQMLRAEDVPARYVTGYTSGEQVDDTTHVVRGLDAHAWVEVYFPDHGWVTFEPTPPSPREDVHSDRLEDARQSGEPNVDTDASEELWAEDETDEEPEQDDDDPEENGSDEPESNETESETPADNETESETDEPSERLGEDSDDGTDETSEETSISVPITRELAAIGLVILVGLAAGVRRTGATSRTRRALGLYWQRSRDDPEADVRVAAGRLDRLFAHQYRPRDRSESRRQYVHDLQAAHEIDPRAMTVVRAYEQATYGDGVDRETADEVVAIVDELVRERVPVVGDW